MYLTRRALRIPWVALLEWPTDERCRSDWPEITRLLISGQSISRNGSALSVGVALAFVGLYRCVPTAFGAHCRSPASTHGTIG